LSGKPKPISFYIRIGLLGLILFTGVLVITGRVYYLQFIEDPVGLPRGTTPRRETFTVSEESIPVARGEIFDRNGRPLVRNELRYDITFDRGFPNLRRGASSRSIGRLISLCFETGVSWTDTLPVSPFPPFTYDENAQPQALRRMARYLDEMGVPPDTPANELIAFMRQEYGIDQDLDDASARRILGVQYEIHLRFLFNDIPPYLFVSDAPLALVTRIEAASLNGVVVNTVPVRQYHTGAAPHILGRVGPIQAHMTDFYRGRGYPMDAIVGLDGVEFAFESILRGEPGRKRVTRDANGQVILEEMLVEPKPGRHVYLTLCLILQEEAERSLAYHIHDLRRRFGGAGSGAVVMLRVGTGEVLAMASYPTFSHLTYDYTVLSADPGEPLFNRAARGTYAPGSTFKMSVMAAALETGVVTPAARIFCAGEFSRYAPSYAPQCHIWRSSRGTQTHGNVNIMQALAVSCNYFFYEIADRTGIEAMNAYAASFGLGQPTGIETGESPGRLAGPETSRSRWQAGHTIQSAIGQHENVFTPLQLASYTATLASRGVRYPVHLLESTRSFNFHEAEPNRPGPVETVIMSDRTIQTILQGMRDVCLRGGTGFGIFGNYPVPVAGKTGSGQVAGQELDNGIWVAYAPFDAPEVAVSVVIEQGGQGGRVAPISRDLFDAYFRLTDSTVSSPGTGVLVR
jgi:penicillin-binding protein 2